MQTCDRSYGRAICQTIDAEGACRLVRRIAGRRDAPPRRTFTIVTTDPNQLFVRVHDRMPVILAPQDYNRLRPLQAPRSICCVRFRQKKMEAMAREGARRKQKNDDPRLLSRSRPDRASPSFLIDGRRLRPQEAQILLTIPGNSAFPVGEQNLFGCTCVPCRLRG